MGATLFHSLRETTPSGVTCSSPMFSSSQGAKKRADEYGQFVATKPGKKKGKAGI